MSFNPRISAGDRRWPAAAQSEQPYGNAALVSARPAWLYSLSGFNSGPAQYIQLHDSAAAVSEGLDCLAGILVPAAQWWYFDFGIGGVRFFNGIYVCNSSTNPAKTIGAADNQFLADYRFKA